MTITTNYTFYHWMNNTRRLTNCRLAFKNIIYECEGQMMISKDQVKQKLKKKTVELNRSIKLKQCFGDVREYLIALNIVNVVNKHDFTIVVVQP